MNEKAFHCQLKLQEQLNISLPLFNAPMSIGITPELVAAVSQNGGLGVIPLGSIPIGQMESFVQEVRARTRAPIAFALPLVPVKTFPLTRDQERYCLRFFSRQLEILKDETGLHINREDLRDLLHRDPMQEFLQRFRFAIQQKPVALISTFGAFREDQEDILRRSGIANIGTATSLREAKILHAARVDALILQGGGAGGRAWHCEDHTSRMDLLTLLTQVQLCTQQPLIACGGIGIPNAWPALQSAGASGVMLGTSFLTTEEAQLPTWVQRTVQDTPCTQQRCLQWGGQDCRFYQNNLTKRLAQLEKMTIPQGAWGSFTAQIRQILLEHTRRSNALLMMGQSTGFIHYMCVSQLISAWEKRLHHDDKNKKTL